MRPVLALLLPLLWTASNAAECPTFAGREWEFTGHLVNRVFPGPPDYESVTSGDEPVTRWYLQLPSPVCFAEYRYLTRFQLVFGPEKLDEYRHLLGKAINAKGTLDEGVPGRDTTSLVLNISSLVRRERERP
jgi:hypothetical protein